MELHREKPLWLSELIMVKQGKKKFTTEDHGVTQRETSVF